MRKLPAHLKIHPLPLSLAPREFSPSTGVADYFSESLPDLHEMHLFTAKKNLLREQIKVCSTRRVMGGSAFHFSILSDLSGGEPVIHRSELSLKLEAKKKLNKSFTSWTLVQWVGLRSRRDKMS